MCLALSLRVQNNYPLYWKNSHIFSKQLNCWVSVQSDKLALQRQSYLYERFCNGRNWTISVVLACLFSSIHFSDAQTKTNTPSISFHFCLLHNDMRKGTRKSLLGVSGLQEKLVSRPIFKLWRKYRSSKSVRAHSRYDITVFSYCRKVTNCDRCSQMVKVAHVGDNFTPDKNDMICFFQQGVSHH